jgi:folate-binding protein YgfZ
MTHPFDELHTARGANFGEYAGKRVPLNYGDAAAEYRTAREAVGIADLSAHGRVEITGKERVQFLNGMVSNHVKSLAAGTGVPAFFLTAQGKIIADCALFAREESFLLTTDGAAFEKLYKKLFALTYAGDFKIADLTKTHAVIGVVGPDARSTLARLANADLDAWSDTLAVEKISGKVSTGTEDIRNYPNGRLNIAGTDVFVARVTRAGEERYELTVPNADAVNIWEALEAAGARPVGWEALDVTRVERGVGRFGIDFDENTLAPEIGLDEAMSFTKGCYVGHETVGKIHWRGHDQTARKLVRLELADATPPAGARIVKDEKEVGVLTSAVRHPLTGKTVALGFVRSAHIAPAAEVSVKLSDETTTTAVIVTE